MAPTISVKHDTFELPGSPPLFAQSWSPPSEVRGAIGIVHGLGEHSGRYAPLAERFAQAGFRVVTYDQRGHGRTAGKRGDVPSYEVLLDDLEVLLAEMATGDASLPKFLFGQSFGGALALNFALRRYEKVGLAPSGRASSPREASSCEVPVPIFSPPFRRQLSLNGIIASSPLLLPTHPPPRWKQLAARCLQRVCPSFRFRTGVQAETLSHDPAVVAAYKADPLVHAWVSARWAVAMLDAGQWALEHAAQLAVPALLLHGTSDPITYPQGTIDFAQRAAHACTLHTFAGLYHELHWEQERNQVFEVILDWLEQ